jgi:hypothetical protein
MKDKFMQWFLSPLAYVIWVSLADKDAWAAESHTIYNSQLKLELWISNGIGWFNPFFNIYNEPADLGHIDRHLLWPRARKLKPNRKKQSAQKIIARAMRMEE